MRKKPPTKHLAPHQFKPGQTGNPEGARAHNPIKKAMKKLTVKTFREVIEAVCVGNFAELKRIAGSPKSSVLQVGLCNSIIKAANAGDYALIRMIVEDIVGKVPNEINVTAQTLNATVDSANDVNFEENVKAAIAALKSEI